MWVKGENTKNPETDKVVKTKNLANNSQESRYRGTESGVSVNEESKTWWKWESRELIKSWSKKNVWERKEMDRKTQKIGNSEAEAPMIPYFKLWAKE